jgi:hypothetical protein
VQFVHAVSLMVWLNGNDVDDMLSSPVNILALSLFLKAFNASGKLALHSSRLVPCIVQH